MGLHSQLRRFEQGRGGNWTIWDTINNLGGGPAVFKTLITALDNWDSLTLFPHKTVTTMVDNWVGAISFPRWITWKGRKEINFQSDIFIVQKGWSIWKFVTYTGVVSLHSLVKQLLPWWITAVVSLHSHVKQLLPLRLSAVVGGQEFWKQLPTMVSWPPTTLVTNNQSSCFTHIWSDTTTVIHHGSNCFTREWSDTTPVI